MCSEEYFCLGITGTKHSHYTQPFSVLPLTQLPMESSPTLPITHLTMILAQWPFMPVTLGLFWTYPLGEMCLELVWMILTMM